MHDGLRHGDRVPRHRRGHAAGSVIGDRLLDRAGRPRSSRGRRGRPRERSPPRTPPSCVTGDAARDWYEPSGRDLDRRVLDDFAPALGEAFGRATAEQPDPLRLRRPRRRPRPTSAPRTGLRLRHVQPTGHYGCTAKPTDLSTSAWVGGATRDFTDVDAHADGRRARAAARLGRAARRPATPAATTRSCRRPRSRT